MSNRLVASLVMSAVFMMGVSCTKVKVPGVGEQKVVLEQLTHPDSIPAKWGKLVSATMTNFMGVESWTQLWFQDEEGTIRVVGFNNAGNYLSKKAWKILRD
jgi:hypothetical protein